LGENADLKELQSVQGLGTFSPWQTGAEKNFGFFYILEESLGT